MPKTSKKIAFEERRSNCPVACSLDIFGDRWSLLIIRDLICGRSRFKEMSASPEGIATNLLSDRLARLVRHDIIEQMPSSDGTKHRAYRLTAKGKSLRPLVSMIKDWGLKWEMGTEVRMSAQV